eukprot:36821_1
MTPNIHHKTMDKLSLAGFEETRITVSPTDMERVEEHIDAFVEPEMKRTDPLQDETYDEVIAHNDDDNDRANIIDDEADKRLETAKSHIDDTGVKKNFFMVRTSIFIYLTVNRASIQKKKKKK